MFSGNLALAVATAYKYGSNEVCNLNYRMSVTMSRCAWRQLESCFPESIDFYASNRSESASLVTCDYIDFFRKFLRKS